MSQVIKFLLRLLIALVTLNPKNAKEKMLIDLLSDAFEIVMPRDTAIDTLPVPEYVADIFEENGIKTVGDALRVYSLGIKTSGIGEKSWEHFFGAARSPLYNPDAPRTA